MAEQKQAAEPDRHAGDGKHGAWIATGQSSARAGRAEHREVIRVVCVSLVGITVAAGAMAMHGRQAATLVLAGLLALMAGILVFHVARGVGGLARQSDLARRSAAEAERHYIDVLWRIVRFVEARDKYTKGHSERVGRLGEQMAGKMGLPPRRCALMHHAGRLHDIGMIAIPEQILSARSGMGVQGFRTIQKHSQIGYEVLKPLQCLAEVLPAIRYHHERMNGTGYPAGLRGEQIPLEARLLAVADAYDAMTHDRPHRAAMTPLAAMKELRRCCPSGYDADCVAALADLVHLPKLERAFACR